MSNFSVLIAGTSSSYLEISKKMLKFHYDDCEVDFAVSGQECIQKAFTNQYDLVLFDYDLGDKNGLEVIESIRAKDVQVPLIMLIEEGEKSKALQAMDKGASDYILKVRGYLTALPFTVRNILERKQLIKNESKKILPLEPDKKEKTEDGHFLLDRRGRFLSANQNMELMTGYSEDELLELTLVDLLPKEKERQFYDWLHLINLDGGSASPFRTEIYAKTGNKIYLKIELSAIKDNNQQVVSYRGKAENISPEIVPHTRSGVRINQVDMINEMSQLIIACYYEPLNVLLERIAEIVCQIFHFKRSTVALLDKRKNAFVKQAMVGYMSLPVVDNRTIEVPREVIERIFAHRFRVKVIYYNQDHRHTSTYLSSRLPERRTQKRRPPSQWHKRDLILVNLMNRNGQTFGYISLDEPSEETIPTRDIFHNLELFGQLASFAIENYYQFSALEKRSRRLKQILVTSNIFKLYLSLNELLKEVVWSIKFSLDFNVVALGLISKRSGNLELKAVACDDKIKLNHLLELNFPLKPLAQLFRDEYNRGKSYFIYREETIFRSFKHIYYGSSLTDAMNGTWPIWGMLLVPIKSKEGKVIGILMVDDPENAKMPTDEVIRTLEILANQVAIAIDNRIMYVQAKKRIQELENNGASVTNDSPDYSTPGIRKLVDRIFK
ncbi:MAG: response regulator [bacterium]